MAGGRHYTDEENLIIARHVAAEASVEETVHAVHRAGFTDRTEGAVIRQRSNAPVKELAAKIRAGELDGLEVPEPDVPEPKHIIDLERLRAENTELRKKVREKQKENVMADVLLEAIQGHATPLVLSKPPTRKTRTGAIEEDVVALFSDPHADQIIKPEHVMGLEDYGWAEFCRRFERWVGQIISHTQDHLKGYDFPRLWVFALGDNVEGDQHGATKHTQWANTMKGALAVGDVLAQGLAELATVFPEVYAVGVPGNHPRFGRKIDWRAPHENFDYLVYSQAATRLSEYIDEGRIHFHAPDSYAAVCQIRGWNFLLTHGHEVRSWNGIPWYGLERMGRRRAALFAETELRHLHYHTIGHFHTGGTLQTPAGEHIINGNWSYTSEYALGQLSVGSRPHQWLFGVHDRHGATWRLPIDVSAHDIEGQSRFDQRILTTLAGLDEQARAGGVPVLKAG